jgi:negative regulator of flagellin synthesis FlgM
MSRIDSSYRSPFFPNSKADETNKANTAEKMKALGRNSYEKASTINSRTGRDARVEIPEAVRDYSRIKRAVDMAPPIDNTAKIAGLKAQIAAGTYEPNYDAIAERILDTEY